MTSLVYCAFDIDLHFLDHTFENVLPKNMKLIDYDKHGRPLRIAIGIKNRGYKDISKYYELYDHALDYLYAEANKREAEYWKSFGEN
jgi:hypothetical protein